jgi:hypothetical protein
MAHGEDETGNEIVRICRYWQLQPRIKASIRLSQAIALIRTQAETAGTAIEDAREELRQFLKTVSPEELRAYEEHFENEERRTDHSE